MRWGAVLRWVLLLICIIQVILTFYLALRSSKELVSEAEWDEEHEEKTLKHDLDGNVIASLSRGRYRMRNLSPKNKEFDIKKNEAAIVLAKQLMTPEAQKEEQIKKPKVDSPRKPVVEIWGKAAIGTYLWSHIIEGKEQVDASGSILQGEVDLGSFIFKYLSGPGLVPEAVSKPVKYLVLVVNGRTPDKVAQAEKWLHFLQNSEIPPKTIIVMLGNEECKNSWLDKWMAPKGFVQAVFLTYDDPRVNNQQFYQWPLGVATYRNFPVLKEEQLSLPKGRKYICNLQATIHPNSSRVILRNKILSNASIEKKCLISMRDSWSPTETTNSMNDYIFSLVQSDLTLCPVGINAETYRVYESLSAGSIPVVEDVATKGGCDRSPWRLLKGLKPPVIWTKNWEDLLDILGKEQKVSAYYKRRRREKAHLWYEWFKLKMRDRFVGVVREKLLS